MPYNPQYNLYGKPFATTYTQLVEADGSGSFFTADGNQIYITNSVGISSSYALTASYAANAGAGNSISSSWASQSLSASWAPFAVSAVSASYALTASYTLTNFVTQSITSSISASYALTASYTTQFPDITDKSGKIGINNTNPQYTLDLNSGSNITSIGNSSGSLTIQTIQTSTDFGNISILSAYGTVQNFSNGGNINLTAGSSPLVGGSVVLTTGTGSNSSNSGNIQLLGNVGIKKSSGLQNSLDVVGNISCSVITASLFYGTSSYSNQFPDITDKSGKIGINQTNPQYTLDLSGSIGNSSGSLIIQGNPNNSVTDVGNITINAGGGASAPGGGNVNINGGYGLFASSVNNNVNITAGGSTYGNLGGIINLIGGQGPSGLGNILLSGSGVGVNTKTPQNSLDVIGNISCSVITASLHFGTASYSNNGLSSSYSVTASYSSQTLTASYIATASNAQTSSFLRLYDSGLATWVTLTSVNGVLTLS